MTRGIEAIKDLDEIEQLMKAYIKSVPETCKYELKKEMMKIGISERHVIKCLDYLLQIGFVKWSRKFTGAITYNPEYKKKEPSKDRKTM